MIQTTILSTAAILIAVISLITGNVVLMEQVPDKAFANRAVEGITIYPIDTVMLWPANSALIKVFNAHHVLCLESNEGDEVALCVGIDTVALNKQGLTFLVTKGTKVT
ncbi:PTS glucose transporter subunit IIA [Candidatus Doolittlea endobia]|uniref:PTS glucose transporter subunit IIA n=1 Tax=Candidatus Doolittlea endobia TaxID=1778262 RepID=UPI0008335F99|nr:PTS glucose transporter subunit IIA [Candidatus Doolittlea endobia]